MEQQEQRSGLMMPALGAVGVVYGDIGTSPLYTIQTIFGEGGVPVSSSNIVGAISAVFWALMLVVTLKYVVLVMRADNHGEGGIISLLAMAVTATASQSLRRKLILLGALGAALFYGDTLLTPSISVLSAVEGIEVSEPGLKSFIVPLAVAVLVLLFLLQRHGTATVGKLFGPIIVLWFLTLGAVGLWHIVHNPAILWALSPVHAFDFLVDRGSGVFLAVGAVVLAITGVEALYADMGHFGRPAIRLAWTGLVLPCLALNYLGQGAMLLTHPAAVSNPFYLSFPPQLMIPAVLLATLATIIASQAVISGAYSMTQQAIQVGLLPRTHIVHTSAREAGQIYLPAANWMLLAAVLATTVGFGSSAALASAYGIAVTGTMLITSVLMFIVMFRIWKWNLLVATGISIMLIVIDALLLFSCSIKFVNGGWFPVALAAGMLVTMWTWKQGRELLLRRIREDDPGLEAFLENIAAADLPRVERTAVFLVANPVNAPQALMHNLKHNQVLHKANLVVTVLFEDVPWVEEAEKVEVHDVGYGFWQVHLRYGFMENPDVPKALATVRIPEVDIDPFTMSYFISRETIVPSTGGKMARWREGLFQFLSKNAGSVVQYFNIPVNNVIELGSRVHI
ncbi:MAG TPA: potassium transporter Kup [Gallionellaceae bacterium]|nr:potassium transporter Kup [Gallionellaceae bacterium]